ncbi:hypothetical protein BBK82_08935 [Lentzea guizhouensis]|uniref:Uncharacterized protein n=1 Tax=Lentzea guizhouensis TaxID=1586287 RepID=A0A1B2HEP7_9PSEU|nr:hypothetical protein BBK82_08935 [Lentzea guizhouensis]
MTPRRSRVRTRLLRTARWLRTRAPRIWKGVRLVLLLVEGVVAPVKGEVALAITARALLVVGDTLVDAGRHGRS